MQQKNKVIVNLSGYRRSTNNNRLSQPRVPPAPQYLIQQRSNDFTAVGDLIRTLVKNPMIQPVPINFVGQQQPPQPLPQPQPQPAEYESSAAQTIRRTITRRRRRQPVSPALAVPVSAMMGHGDQQLRPDPEGGATVVFE